MSTKTSKHEILNVIESYLKTAESHIDIAYDLASDRLNEKALAKELEYLKLDSFDIRRHIKNNYRNIYRGE